MEYRTIVMQDTTGPSYWVVDGNGQHTGFKMQSSLDALKLVDKLNELDAKNSLVDYEHYHGGYQKAQAALEKAWMENQLKKWRYNQSKVAREMGISRGTLRTKMSEYFGNKYFRAGEGE